VSSSPTFVTFDGVLGLFLLAVLANVAYSAVYLADVFIQFSGFRASRARWRWILLGVGFAFAGDPDALFLSRHVWHVTSRVESVLQRQELTCERWLSSAVDRKTRV